MFFSLDVSVKIDGPAKTAILSLAGGDMRKVLNILQACHMAYGVVTATNVYLCTGNPMPSDIDSIMNSLMNDGFAQAFDFLLKLQVEKGLSLVDIVQRIHQRVLTLDCAPEMMMILLDQLSNIEYRLACGPSEKLQLGALVGAFTLARGAISKTTDRGHKTDQSKTDDKSSKVGSSSSSASSQD